MDEMTDECPNCGAEVGPRDMAERDNPLPGRSTHVGDCWCCSRPLVGRLASGQPGWEWGVKDGMQGDVRFAAASDAGQEPLW